MGCGCTKDAAGHQPNRKSNYEIEQKKDKGNNNHQNDNINDNQQSSFHPKRIKYVRTEEQKQLQQLYLYPSKLVETCLNNEKEFINTVKKFKVTNLSRFRGYNMSPSLTLASGRQINTEKWCPLTFALVLNKGNLYSFILKEANFNLKAMLTIERSNNQDFKESEEQEHEGIVEIIKLMIENNSQLLQKVFNDLAYLFKSYHIKKLIPFIMLQNEAQKLLEILINSRAFIIVYVQKVKNISSQKYKGSFEFFLEKYFSNYLNNPSCNKTLAKVFANAPFNVGFGSAMILNYKKQKQIFENLDILISKCCDLKDFDVYRMGNNVGDLDFKQMDKNIQQEVKLESQSSYNKFVQALRTKVENRGKTELLVQDILKSAKGGDLKAFQKKLNSLEMSKETIFQIQGLKEQEEYQVEIKALNIVQSFNLSELNPLELSCVFGHAKILQYLSEEQGLKSQKEFQISKKMAEHGQFEKMPFIQGPIFKKDAETLRILLNLTHLWNYEDFQQVLTLLKQTKWLEGFQVALQSRLSHELFMNRTLQLKFRFIRDILIFPFKIDIQDESMSDMSMNQDEQEMQNKRNILSNEDKLKLRKIIKQSFCEEPYIGAFLFQEYAQRRDTYKDVAEVNDLPENFVEQVEYLRQCVTNISEIDMHDYIFETQGQVVNILEQVIRISISQEEEEQKHFEVVRNEIEYLIEKLKDHATMAYIQEQKGNEQQ